MKKTQVILIIGSSGSGKSYLQKSIVNSGFAEVISATTREMREGEEDGKHYHFKKDEAHFFEDDYIEHAKVGDKFYGTPVKEFYKSDKIVHVVEPYGALQIKDKFKNTPSIDIKIIFLDIDDETCAKNLAGAKGYLDEKDKSRLNRDKTDNITERLKETGLTPFLTISSLDYDVSTVISLIS